MFLKSKVFKIVAAIRARVLCLVGHCRGRANPSAASLVDQHFLV
jgi:hypothetical protein